MTTATTPPHSPASPPIHVPNDEYADSESYAECDLPYVLSELLIHDKESLATILAGIREELRQLNAHLRQRDSASHATDAGGPVPPQ
jgi:hypothetical protein